ncbi:MAG: DUF971 domain-containing protein [Chloroflexota bacterium]
MQPLKISKTADGKIKTEWSDGFAAVVTPEAIRKDCPCAVCKGEHIPGKGMTAPALMQFKPGMYKIKSIEPTGNYGFNLSWEDGHDSGIYTYELWREIFEKHGKKD